VRDACFLFFVEAKKITYKAGAVIFAIFNEISQEGNSRISVVELRHLSTVDFYLQYDYTVSQEGKEIISDAEQRHLVCSIRVSISILQEGNGRISDVELRHLVCIRRVSMCIVYLCLYLRKGTGGSQLWN
jgi:hypothetical protein